MAHNNKFYCSIFLILTLINLLIFYKSVNQTSDTYLNYSIIKLDYQF